MADRNSISDTQLRIEMLSLFSSGNTAKSNIYELLRTKYKLEKQRCLRMFDIVILEYQKLTKEVQDKEIHTKVSEGLKQGLKSKLEYCLEIQALLDGDETSETIWDFKNDKPITYTRQLTPIERKALYERISKFEGMDAPIKQAAVKTDGTDIEDNNLTDDQVDKILNAIKDSKA